MLNPKDDESEGESDPSVTYGVQKGYDTSSRRAARSKNRHKVNKVMVKLNAVQLNLNQIFLFSVDIPISLSVHTRNGISEYGSRI